MSYQEQFEEVFVRAINDRLLYIPDQLGEVYSCNFEEYHIYINCYSDGSIYRGRITKGGKVIWNEDMGKSIFASIRDKIEANYEEHMEGYFSKELDFLTKKAGDEMSPVFQDVKRLKEIATEATEIHNKYKKSFFNLFS